MAASVHEDIIELAVARIQALSLVNSMQTRVIRRAVLAGSWETGAPSGDFIVVSGWGQLRDLGTDTSCTFDLAYPLQISPIYRTTREWDATDEDAQMSVTQKLLDAFIEQPLTLTYTGAKCYNVVLFGGVTVQGLIETFQQITRQLTFEVWVRQHRTA